MPASKKPVYIADSRIPDSEISQVVAEEDFIPSRAGKKKTKNAATRPLSSLDHADKATESVSMAPSQLPASSPNPTSSILGQLPQTFSQNRNPAIFETVNDSSASQKVSDEHTPPVDIWARDAVLRRTSPVESLPGLQTGTSPQYEPGFSTRGHFNHFNTRSPPISPPMRNARPVSFGGGIPAMPNSHRHSTSPYGYGMPAYGSPPAPPHLPQQHFYSAHDVDLGLRPALAPLPEPAPLKFAQIPGSGSESRQAVLLAIDGQLHVVGYNGEKLEHVGSLGGVQGTVTDATLLTWNTGEDPCADLRPLVALVVHGSEVAQSTFPRHDDQTFSGALNNVDTKVVVFSLSKSIQVAELLQVPHTASGFPGTTTSTPDAANLKIHASGNFLVVSSADSGEVFVYTLRQGENVAVFECLAKYWTTLQPHLQSRDSAHGPTSDSDVSPADLGRGPAAKSPPILSLGGRWLAYCPASTSSQRSIGAIMGGPVVYNKISSINSGSAPGRPLANCEVDSPDVDTFFSKVAKGFAQEAVRGARWIGEKGMQTWQSYWKKDTGSPSMAPLPSTSPPVYSPYLGLAQFPPTHGTEPQDVSRGPDLVTIIDLKLLQDNQGRKGLDFAHQTTFQPPGGCSFLSLAPTCLSLLTASRKGDVQYVWDLMQMKYIKASIATTSTESGRVRQIARYERLSPSTIIDIAWDGPTGYRFALLTKNRTIHIFDLPKTSFQWPPPIAKKIRPTSAPVDPRQAKVEHEPAPSGGFLASAMSIAGRTQPMLASLRGRAPSMSSGLAGAGPSAIGFASTAGIKSGSRAVAAGLSKSLGAASETVASIRHANQSRLHLRTPLRVEMFCWLQREGKSVLSILDENNIKNYYVRVTKPREQRQIETVSVFDARKAVAVKLPKAPELASSRARKSSFAEAEGTNHEIASLMGFWRPRPGKDPGLRTPHPLASAEIETNAPYQPFHLDRRVIMSATAEGAASVIKSQPTGHQTRNFDSQSEDKWVFGSDISSSTPTVPRPLQTADTDFATTSDTTSLAVHTDLESAPVHATDDDNHPVASGKKKKGKKGRAQTRLLEEDEMVGSYSARDVSFDPGDDLLAAEDLG